VPLNIALFGNHREIVTHPMRSGEQ